MALRSTSSEPSGGLPDRRPVLQHSTTGSGAGMGNYNSDPTVANCILWGDRPDEIFILGGTPIVTHNDVQGGFAGAGNINADPLFVDPLNGDFRLSPGSPCDGRTHGRQSGQGTTIEDIQDEKLTKNRLASPAS